MARIMVDFSGDVVRRQKLWDTTSPLRSAKPEPKPEAHVRAKKEKAAKQKASQPAPKKKQKTPPVVRADQFLELYLAKIKKSIWNSGRIAEDETNPERAYYAARIGFLRSVRSLLAGREAKFFPMDEPFFWAEFKRLSGIRACNGPEGSGKGWRRAASAINQKLVAEYNKLRSARDGYVMKGVGLTAKDVVFAFAGALMYLERAIAANPDDQFLRDLLERYKIVFKNSTMEALAVKLASKLIEHRSSWRNQETLDYLIELVRELKEKNPETDATSAQAPVESSAPTLS